MIALGEASGVSVADGVEVGLIMAGGVATVDGCSLSPGTTSLITCV